MAMEKTPRGEGFFTIQNLRGGMNDTDPPQSLPDDQVVEATNVEFIASTLGERRRGSESVSLSGATNISGESHIAFLAAHLPVNTTVENSYLFAVGATPGSSAGISYRSGGSWNNISPVDAFTNTSPDVFKMHAVSTHGKLFICYNSSVDRMHVWDGTTLRRTGVATTTSAPTAVDTAVAGSFTGTRYYRVRFIERNLSNVVLRRSEPSGELTFNPNGSFDGAVVTRPTTPANEGITHWELEASSGDGNFYVIATTAIGTTTYTDTNNPATAYANFELSEDVGGYENIESAKFVIADQDRLIFGGSWEDATHGSRISWTPPYAATGVGNDERIRADVDSFVDLDWQEAGELTGLSRPINGTFYAFKNSRIYKIQRTGDPDTPYDFFLITTSRGALWGSVIDGVDETGRPCVYFLDPAVGPCRISSFGDQQMTGLRGTWETVNTTADDVVCHGIYYPDKFQVQWWVATNNAQSPNYMMVSQTTELNSQSGATERGWSVWNGTNSEAFCSCILPEPTTDADTGIVSLTYRPYIGMSLAGDSGGVAAILRCDTGDDDAGDAYTAKIVTKPYIVAGLSNYWGAMMANLLARPLDDSGVTLNVKFIRDFGKERNTVNTDFVASEGESIVNKKLDNLVMSHSYAIQVEFSDPDIVI